MARRPDYEDDEDDEDYEDDEVPLPADAFVVGEPISVVEIEYDGKARCGLLATCRRQDGRDHVVALFDVVFPAGSIGARYMAAYRLGSLLDPEPAPEPMVPLRSKRHKVADGEIDLARPVDLVVLAIRKTATRCRLLGSDREITLRPKNARIMVPGEIVTVHFHKEWRFAGHPYLSGDVGSIRLDVPALGFAPLRLDPVDTWDPAGKEWGEEKEWIREWPGPIVERGLRPAFEMEQIMPGQDPDEMLDDMDPIGEAVECSKRGDSVGAREILMDLLAADLRCLDAHAHLGTSVFGLAPDEARRHYEVGVGIGDLSLGDDFDGVLAWGHLDNRPFLRCLHGLGVCLWRLGHADEAARVFERMLWLNPTDNQGVRFCLDSIRLGKSWDQDLGGW